MNKKENNFKCLNCGKEITSLEYIGTKHRNHCPFCLYSKHVDLKKPGDRKSLCKSLMRPIGITFKQEGKDKYGNAQTGEIMLIHKCCNNRCNKISINRIAADDDVSEIYKVYEESLRMSNDQLEKLKKQGIYVLNSQDEEEIKVQLFGKTLR